MTGPAAARLVVVGEALVDVVPDADGGTRDLPGGSPANVAVTLGRLGHRPTLVTSLAQDARGALVRDWLEASDVEVRLAAPACGRTSTAAVVLGADGGASYEFDLDWDLPADLLRAALDGADVVHTGSIATVLDPGADAVEVAMRAARGRALVSFDPNARPVITPDVDAARTRVERLVGLSDLVKVSDEDLGWYYPGQPAPAVARRWATAGPVLVVVTLGAQGALVVRGEDVVTVPGVRVQVADTIGAGDTFTGALLDALTRAGVGGPRARGALADLSVRQLADAAAWAARAAAVTVSRPGADPPTRAELDAADA
ncbi:carbohydrate kinase family protein [Xylanimonas ulmi]|uniref:Fructokinase n=1 Tax=Xylanimonas ulmi TaxID=228973 RepID=A0A4Q7M5G8_9MICO|nr:carbohydrate kinase [Xylanibacterium ulmi]RZS62884.1 fructokinase [Xylanibacterium ulmi]